MNRGTFLVAVTAVVLSTSHPSTRGASTAGSVAAESPAAPATRPSFHHPAADAAARFQAAITRGDADDANRATADTVKPLADQPKRISQLIARQKNLKAQFMVHDVQIDGDLAAAIVGNPARIGDKIFESEIWFLIRQHGEWRVLPDCNDYERPEYGFDATRIEAYKKLEERAEKRSTELRKEITGCEC
jgi:hypothetical protein